MKLAVKEEIPKKHVGAKFLCKLIVTNVNYQHTEVLLDKERRLLW